MSLQDGNTTADAPLAVLLVSMAATRKLSGDTQEHHRSTLKAFELFLKRPALVADLNEEALTVRASKVLDDRATSGLGVG